MIIGQSVSTSIRLLCKQRNIEWKKISINDLYTYLQENNRELFDQIFFEKKLDKKAKEIKMHSFHDYLNAT